MLQSAPIRSALADADLRVLLMSLYHITGDDSWLEEPFLPSRDIRLVADPSAGLPVQVQERIRSAAEKILRRGVPTAKLPAPDDDQLARMMSVCLGENVPPEYAPMMRQEMGLESPRVDAKDPVSVPVGADLTDQEPVVIVGAGISGLAAGAMLTRAGVAYRILEKDPALGGTWYENQYPGAGVDTPSHAYCFSFGPKYPWSRYFAKQDEVWDYLRTFAADQGVEPNIEYETEVIGATWNADEAGWHVRVQRSGGEPETLWARHLVSAIGILNKPKTPPLDGLEHFRGPAFHASRWPEDLDLAGRTVAVIGTGATAMQVVPAVAPFCERVTVFQRSPGWVRPAPSYHEVIPEGTQWLMEHMPYYREWFRLTMLWRFGDGVLRTLRRDPDWAHPERAVGQRNDLHREELTAYLKEELRGRPDLIAETLPDYPVFGKRILLDNGWFSTLREPNVDLCTDSIERVNADGIMTDSGNEVACDAIVFATGFDTDLLTANMDIVGEGGARLRDEWGPDDPKAYLGMSVPRFPNLHILFGPGTGLGHGGSAIFQAECQARYLLQLLHHLHDTGHHVASVKEAAYEEYVRKHDAEHEQLVWTHPGMRNWYRNSAGRITSIMPWRLVDYWHMTAEVDVKDYVLS